MMSTRCKMAVREELNKLGVHFIIVDLGEIEIMEELSRVQREELKMGLSQAGFELMDDKKAILIQKIKNEIIDMVYHSDEIIKTNFSDVLSKKLNQDYTYLSNLFSAVQGSTIEHFVIALKIARIKELMIYGELNMTEISYKMNYSSVGHLSNQFKKVTGLSPTQFKQLNHTRLVQIEELESKKLPGSNGNSQNNITYTKN